MRASAGLPAVTGSEFPSRAATSAGLLPSPDSSGAAASRAAGHVAGADAQDPVTITEFPVPVDGSGLNPEPMGITAGPDGNLWFTGWDDGTIGRITPSGVVTEFPTPNANTAYPFAITTGSDGNLWFTESGVNEIGRITPSGVVTEFPVPTGGSDPTGITTGPDGNVWFTEELGNKIGRITPSGVITEFPVPTAGSQPFWITAGPDGNLWFTEENANQIGRITPSGVITEFNIPSVGGNIGPYGAEPIAITTGPDGDLWFTEYYGGFVGRLDPTEGVVNQFALPSSFPEPWAITTGPDGNLWLTSDQYKYVAQMSTAGAFNEFLLSPRGGQDDDITAGPDGNVWFACGGDIGRANLSGAAPDATSTTLTETGGGSAAGFPVAFSGTVTDTTQSPNVPVTSGSVSLYDNGSSTSFATASVTSAGTFTASSTYTSAGSHSVVAVYSPPSGSEAYSGSSSAPAAFTVAAPTSCTGYDVPVGTDSATDVCATWPEGSPPPGVTAGSSGNWTLTLTGTITLPGAGDWVFCVADTQNFVMSVDGNLFLTNEVYEQNGNNGDINFDFLGTYAGTMAGECADAVLAGGQHTIEIDVAGSLAQATSYNLAYLPPGGSLTGVPQSIVNLAQS